MSSRYEFGFDERLATVQGAESYFKNATKNEIKEMRKEYTKMRDVAQKRIKRLGENFSKTKAYSTHPEGFQKLKDIDPQDFAKSFSELAKFVKGKRSTVSGQKSIRDKTIRTWQEHGLDLNKQNYDRVIRVMEEMRRRKIIYGSDKAVEAVNATLELSDQSFNDWIDHLETMLEHSDDLSDMKDEMSGYQEVDVDDFINEMGW